MTAQDWATTDDVNAMLDAIRGKASDRKLLLFACGCCRLVEAKLPAVAMMAKQFELQSERPSTREEKWSMLTLAGSSLLGNFGPLIGRVLSGTNNEPWTLAKNVSSTIQLFTRATPMSADEMTAEVLQLTVNDQPNRSALEQADVLREVVANPFLEIAFDPRWRSETVLGIAASIDEASAWDRLPILADAMQDAGCEVPAILDHCRDPQGVHRRGCWVLDGILDRA